jgi:DNA modification methylase
MTNKPDFPGTIGDAVGQLKNTPCSSHIQQRDLDSLKPNPRNARTHSPKQISQIAASIGEFGFVGPIVINKAGMILAGHGRYEAAKLLNLKSVPTILLERLTEKQQRAYVLADNKIAQSAGWDPDILKIEFEELATLDLTFDIEITGFETAEIDLLLDGSKLPYPVDPADLIPAIAEKAVSRIGDVWQLGEHKLTCGDARRPDTLSSIVERPVRSAFLDPPYNVAIEHAGGLGKIHHRQFKMASGELTPAQYRHFLGTCFQNAAAVSMDGAIHFACIDWRHLEDLAAAGRGIYSKHLNTCVWVKDNGGMGSFYRSRHEFIMVFKVGKAPHLNTIELGKTGRYRTNVWEYPGVNTFRKGRLDDLAMHPTVKPTALVVDAIKDCSRRGEIVIDLFGGAGTTLIAAEKCGRCARIVEIDPLYVDVIVRRWQKLTGEFAKLSGSNEHFNAIAEQRFAAGRHKPEIRR